MTRAIAPSAIASVLVFVCFLEVPGADVPGAGGAFAPAGAGAATAPVAGMPAAIVINSESDRGLAPAVPGAGEACAPEAATEPAMTPGVTPGPGAGPPGSDPVPGPRIDSDPVGIGQAGVHQNLRLRIEVAP